MTPHGNYLKPPSDQVSAERLDGEVIAIHLGTGTYFSMSGTAADIWTAASSGLHSDAWLAALDAAYGTHCPREDIERFLQVCFDNALLTESAPAEDTGWVLPEDYAREAWQEPSLEVFEDLRDLLLVDPIHETSALGWPHVEPRDA